MGRGQLVFKGDKPPPKKKKKRSQHESYESSSSLTTAAAANDSPSGADTGAPDHPAAPPASASAPTPAPPAVARPGAGRITTSGTVVTGHGTRFNAEVQVGDALLATVPGTQREELRVVTMRLSDTAINLSSAFGSDLRLPTEYRYIPRPRAAAAPAQRREGAAAALKPEEKAAFGTFLGQNELIYQEKTEHGSYRIKKQKLEGDVTRSDLLAMRARKKSDKYC